MKEVEAKRNLDDPDCFSGLGYSLANEDSTIEYDLARELGAISHHLTSQRLNSILVIAGSGSRVLPLAALNPKRLQIVDKSPAQLELTQLRLNLAAKLEPQEFLGALGYQKINSKTGARYTPEWRIQLIDRLGFSIAEQKFAKSLLRSAPLGIIWVGRWEQMILKLGRLLRLAVGNQFLKVFEVGDLEAQKKFVARYWPERRLRLVLGLLTHEKVMNRLFYKGHFAGTDTNTKKLGSTAEFLTTQFRNLFDSQLARGNYFMQLLFLGEMPYQEGWPLETQERILEKIGGNETSYDFLLSGLSAALIKEPHDFYSLSDVVSYLSESEGKQLLAEIIKSGALKATVVIRKFRKGPAYFNGAQLHWNENLAAGKAAFERDCTGLYNFSIFTQI